MRMKNVPPRGSVECWSERTMFAPRRVEEARGRGDDPGRSGQEISRRVIGGAGGVSGISVCFVTIGLGPCGRGGEIQIADLPPPAFEP